MASSEVDSAGLKNYLDRNTEAKLVVVALYDFANLGFGIVEKDLVTKTGLEVQKVRQILSYLQSFRAICSRCTQIGTAGPFDHFFRLHENVVVVKWP